MDIIDPLIKRAHHLSNAAAKATRELDAPRTRPAEKLVFDELEPLLLELTAIVALGKISR